jgi:hypothetical protein
MCAGWPVNSAGWVNWGFPLRVFLNFAAFQLGWFAAVLGAGRGAPWLAVAVIPAVLLFDMLLADDWREELALAGLAAVMGFAFDTSLIAAGVFLPRPFLFPRPFSPAWMVLLWVNQATTLNCCLAWLRGRYLAGALFGAIGGPLAYLAGAKLGAAALPSRGDLLILAIAWAAAFPALLAAAAFVRGRFTARN